MRNSYTIPMSNDELRNNAPAIFANEPFGEVSNRYKFIPTIQVVDILRDQGWNPVQAFTNRTRFNKNGENPRDGFQKHSIRFAHQDNLVIAGDSRPEILLTNSHDAKAAYQLHAAIFRMICSNGMVIADSTFEKIAIRHQGFDESDVIDASFRVINEIPKIAESVERFRAIELNEGQQIAYANAAIKLRWADTGTEPIESAQLLRLRRHEDKGNDLWTTYNIVQENLLKGGLRSRRNPETGRRMASRGVKSINEDIRLNKALWTLTDEMAKLVSV